MTNPAKPIANVYVGTVVHRTLLRMDEFTETACRQRQSSRTKSTPDAVTCPACLALA